MTGGTAAWVAALPLGGLVSAFLLATAVVALAGVRLTGTADRLADRTGLGEALAGVVLLGMATSLAGVVVSVTAAVDGRASLAFSNAVGGIAAQTAFLAVADVMHRRANLEHAAAELANLMQAALLCLMLSLPLLAAFGPEVSVLGVHPVSLALPVIWVAGARAGVRLREAPTWRPVATPETRRDVPEAEAEAARLGPLVLRFAGLTLALGLSGWVIAETGGALADRLGISETAVGALLTAVATSLPELVTTLAAVRRGAVQLAVGGIVGGNGFDVLFLSASDVAWREGSIHHAVGRGDLFWLAVGLSSTAVLLIGMIVRERRGPGGIGFESAAVLALWVGAAAAQAWAG